jgi:hypothetical protein
MRTKTLLLTAAVLAAGLGASVAQSVFSVNAVGYVNLVYPGSGFKIIANPLNATNNTIGFLLPNVPDFTTLYKWNEGLAQFDIATFFFGWDHPEYTLKPGEGAFITSGAPFTNTFVGDVLQGSLTNPIPAGYSIRGSLVPQTGTVSALGLTMNDFDTIYQWNPALNAGSGGYDIFTYFFGSWGPSEPSISVGEAVFMSTGGPVNWTRTFSVN